MSTPSNPATVGSRFATWFHRWGSPRWFYERSRRWAQVCGVLAALLLLVGFTWGLAFAPADYQQGNSYRIMFVHVPAAILGQSSYMMAAAAGLVLLVWRMKLADVALEAIVPIGAAMTALALFSGGVWGKPTWGTWWDWDARTTSMLILLFLFIGLGALRGAIARPESAARACAVLALVGVVNIPIIKYSVEWWNTLHQPSSFSLTSRPAMPASMYLPLLVNVLGFYCLFATTVLVSMGNVVLRREARTRWVRELAGAA